MKVAKIFLIILILIGLTLLYFGASNSYNLFEKTKNYVSVKGVFIDSKKHSNDDSAAYTLIYSYDADGNRYDISTDYETGAVPAVGTVKTIRYNPNNPNEAYISGFDVNGVLIFMGVMFLIFPLLVLISLSINNEVNDKKKRLKSKIFQILIGAAFAFLGSSVYSAMCMGGDSLSPIVAFQSAGLWIVVPILIFLAGIYVLITAFLPDTIVKKYIFKNKTNKNVRSRVNFNSSIFPVVFNFILLWQIVVALIFTIIVFWLLINIADSFFKIFLIPFAICGLAMLFRCIATFLKSIIEGINNRSINVNPMSLRSIDIFSMIQRISNKVYTITFFVFWFGFLSYFDYIAFQQIDSGGALLLLFSLVFWAVGIFSVYKKFIK